MAIINTRRLAPLLIVTTLATGGISLTTTSAFAATTATATGLATDTDDPGSSILHAYSKHGDRQKIQKIPADDPVANGGVVAPGMDPYPDSDEVNMGSLWVAESRTGHARPGPIITNKTASGGNGNPEDATGGDTQTGGNGNPDAATGGDTQPPTGQTSDNSAANSDPGPGQNVDYAIWTNPNPGPVVN
ncbi:hypothetical protein SAMN05216532_8266 [Streptomyces sp. 2231.1]|uniref:hypothetical protein n=1 Tax=Streptomyces sp. 2231.1 TaxID=1855347 RepID=UPI0008968726|nr:hypothetical protein [Streptomyces sp. 2231.1]SEE66818.1 hypothetical protein SAMN05216532_8266 [Streptomyces sp. 2231.1]